MADDSTSYVFSFDVQEFTRNMAELQAAYEVFSNRFKNTSDELDVSLSGIENKIIHISSYLDSSYSKLNNFYTTFHDKMKESARLFEEVEEKAKSLQDQLNSMVNFDLPNAPAAPRESSQSNPFSFAITGTAESVEDFQKSMATAEMVSKAAQKAIKEAEKAEKTWKNSAKKIGGYLVKEISNAKSRISGIISSFGGGALGLGAMALVGSMVLGFKEGQRKGAERGELANVLESAGGLFEKTSQQAIGWASKYQEEAQFKYGIGRKEIQSVFDSIVKGGHAAELKMSDFSKAISDVDANILSQGVALDKAFNLAAGTSINQAIKHVQEFGGTVEGALDKIKRLDYAAQSSGMSIEKYTNAVLSAKSAMFQYKVDMDEVDSVLKGIKKTYEDMGLDESQAGAIAAKTVEGLGGAFERMPEPMQQAFAIQYFAKRGIDLHGKGYEANVRLGDLFAQGGEASSNVFKEWIVWVNEEAGSYSSDEYGKRVILEKDVGLTALQAKGVSEIYEKGNLREKGLGGLSDDQIKDWKKTYDIEGSQLTDIQKNQRDLINGLAKVGEGLLSISANILAVITLGIRTIPALVHTAVTALDPTSSKEDVNKAMDTLSKIGGIQKGFFDDMLKGVDKTAAGFLQVANALGDTVNSIDPTKNLRKSITADVGPMNWTRVWNKIEETSDAISKLTTSQTAQEQFMISLKGQVEHLSSLVLNKTGIMSDEDYKMFERQRERDELSSYDDIARRDAKKLKSEKEWESAKPPPGVSRKGVPAVIRAEDLDKSEEMRRSRRSQMNK